MEEKKITYNNDEPEGKLCSNEFFKENDWDYSNLGNVRSFSNNFGPNNFDNQEYKLRVNLLPEEEEIERHPNRDHCPFCHCWIERANTHYKGKKLSEKYSQARVQKIEDLAMNIYTAKKQLRQFLNNSEGLVLTKEEKNSIYGNLII